MAERIPQVDVVLSRTAYRQGGKLVGTIRVTNRSVAGAPRHALRSLELCVMGRCRLDPRWHNIREYKDIQLVAKNSLLWGLHHDTNSVCFWATQSVDLLQYTERLVGRWDEVKPKPIHLEEGDGSNVELGDASLNECHFSCCFQAHLPVTLPPSMLGVSCRYYYIVVVKVLQKTQKTAQWIQMPFLVLTQHPDLKQQPTGESVGLSRFRITPCNAMIHSTGMPCSVSAVELSQSSGTLTVNRHGASHYRHVQREDPGHFRTLRVADPSGAPVCVLTIMGSHPMHPGSRIILKFDFPFKRGWVPCHQISAGLQGEEVAVTRGSSSKRARSFIWGTEHEFVHPGSVDQVALHLALPLNAPCTARTDVVSISIRCVIDISVEQGNPGALQNLRLEIPFEVTHGVAAYERKEDDDRLRDFSSVDELIGCAVNSEQFDIMNDPSSFQSTEIVEELKVLSLQMADECTLRLPLRTIK